VISHPAQHAYLVFLTACAPPGAQLPSDRNRPEAERSKRVLSFKRWDKEKKVGTRIQRGFTLIELMLIVAIISIMVAIAFPAYQDYTVRTKVSELVLAASAFRTTISEKAQNDGGVLTSAGVGLTVAATGRVSGGSVTDGGVVTISGSAATVGTAVTITFTPSVASDGKVLWVCTTATALFKYVPSECRH
jgi:type IV pilus assembly protein PilA